MKYLQTLWTAKKSLKEDSFSWKSPQYNLLSWALSAHSIAEHTDNLTLYTDTHGKEVLVDKLQLPYTDVVVAYDNLDMPQDHWAIPKIKTYKAQTEAFLHFDGDVYLPNALPEEILNADVVAQNEETTTEYSHLMYHNILMCNPYLPENILTDLLKPDYGSYNAGIIGGNDMEFLKAYVKESLEIIEVNEWNTNKCRHTDVNHNLLFEQILLYTLASEKEKTVTCMFDKMNDNGYTDKDVVNLSDYDSAKMIHMLGGMKQRDDLCLILESIVQKRYPETYERVISYINEQ